MARCVVILLTQLVDWIYSMLEEEGEGGRGNYRYRISLSFIPELSTFGSTTASPHKNKRPTPPPPPQKKGKNGCP